METLVNGQGKVPTARDVEHILGVLLMAWYFLTPVLFSIDIVAARPTEGLLLRRAKDSFEEAL